MSKNYYPELFDELQKKDTTITELIAWLCRHEPFAVIKAIKAVRLKKEKTKI